MKKHLPKFIILFLITIVLGVACENQFVIDILPKYKSGAGKPGGNPGKENPGEDIKTPALFSVNFNSNGGTTVPSIKNLERGSTIEKPSNPSKDYFKFSLWYKEAGLQNEWNFDTDIVESDIILYAGWNFAGIEGSGTEYDPYVVYDEETLLAVGRGTGKRPGWTLSRHYRQIDDIELKNSDTPDGGNWTPIGQFTGVYDGNGKTVNGLKTVDPGKDRQGMFSTIGSGGMVKNLLLTDVTIIGKSHTGGIAGESYGTVQGCYISGTVESQQNHAGGAVGTSYGIVQNCHSACSVIGSHVGGIVGNNQNGIIQNCYASGDISGKGSGRAGGIVGQNYSNSNVRNCVALNTSVIAESSYVGRIAGADGILKNNYARDDMVTIKDNGKQYNPSSGLEKRDGASIGPVQFNNEFWWKDSDTWHSADSAFVWNFSTVWEWGDGLPVLKD